MDTKRGARQQGHAFLGILNGMRTDFFSIQMLSHHHGYRELSLSDGFRSRFGSSFLYDCHRRGKAVLSQCVDGLFQVTDSLLIRFVLHGRLKGHLIHDGH